MQIWRAEGVEAYEADKAAEGTGAEEQRESEDEDRRGVKEAVGRERERIFEEERVVNSVFHVEFWTERERKE